MKIINIGCLKIMLNIMTILVLNCCFPGWQILFKKKFKKMSHFWWCYRNQLCENVWITMKAYIINKTLYIFSHVYNRKYGKYELRRGKFVILDIKSVNKVQICLDFIASISIISSKLSVWRRGRTLINYYVDH